jgi:hypothetical protein
LFSLALLLTSGCGADGAGGLSDQLIWAANRMALLSGSERVVTYHHDSQAASFRGDIFLQAGRWVLVSVIERGTP